MTAEQDSAVPWNVHPSCPKGKTLSCNEHLNYTVLQPQQKSGISKTIR